MKILVLGLLLAAQAAFAQNALWLDLSGEWRKSSDDKPQYAQAGFDDTGWETVRMPWTSAPPRGIYWLRTKAVLPEGTDTKRLALTLGSVGEAYEVFVNGSMVGKFGGFSNSEAQVARPMTFDIPAEAAGSLATVEVAVRIWKSFIRGSRQWIRFSDGPYLLTYSNQFPKEFGALLLRETQWSRSPDLALAAIQTLMAILLLVVWWTNRGRLQFLWLALFLLNDGSLTLSQLLLTSPDAFPWSWRVRLIAGFALSTALFAQFCLADVRRYRLPAHFAIGLALLTAVFARTTDSFDTHAIALNATRLFTIGLIAFTWWRNEQKRSPLLRHSMAVLLASTVVVLGNRMGQQFGFGERFELGEFEVSTSLPITVLLALVIVAILLYELLVDRRERQRLAAELEAARAVQQLLLPSSDLRSIAWESDAAYEPAQEVGGDFYWNRTADDGSLIVVVGDVSGKGLKAAMLVSVAIGVLRNEKSADPASILVSLNDSLVGHTGGGFVTAVVARFTLGGPVTVASAGHPSPYCDGREMPVEAGLPLGIAAGVSYPEVAVVGERFTFVSDGVMEAENAQRELFGFDRTRDISIKSARQIADAAKHWGQTDDITVVTVRRTS